MTHKIRLKSALSVILIPMGVFVAMTTSAVAQTTNCTSYVFGNTITTNCYGGGLPRPGFTSSPALRGYTADIPAAIQRGMRDAAALRTQRLQNQLLQLQLQQMRQQQRF